MVEGEYLQLHWRTPLPYPANPPTKQQSSKLENGRTFKIASSAVCPDGPAVVRTTSISRAAPVQFRSNIWRHLHRALYFDLIVPIGAYFLNERLDPMPCCRLLHREEMVAGCITSISIIQCVNDTFAIPSRPATIF